MIKVGVTGNKGFIGSHVCNNVDLCKEEFELIPFEKTYFDDDLKLNSFVQSCDVIIHLAALNRHDDAQFLHDKNVELTQKILDACTTTKSFPKIIFSSSLQQFQDNLYGKSKKNCSDLIFEWSKTHSASSSVLIIPNVFGPFGKPNYNSFVSTFCTDLLIGKSPTILVDNEVKFIYVDELVQIIVEEVRKKNITNVIEVAPTYESKVSEVLAVLKSYHLTYFVNNSIPSFPSSFHHNLFNTFRSYINHQDFFPVQLTQHTDNRGAFIEILRVETGGQISYSTTHPSIVRGNHFHKRKIERFTVIQGKALIQLRKFNTEDKMEFYLDGDTPSFVDMPIWFTHNIKNIGADTLITVFWINEAYDSNNPDTYFENV
jgi:UDP-2-acetamido-2,6-beta-L-arabino-hexul-4-ose reductase